MKSIWIIAHNTFREIIRDRILYGLVIFALLLIGISLVLGQLSFAEQKRISIDFGFAAIHFSAVVLSIFIGSTLVSKEIDKKTVMTLLARPISRFEFLFGKFIGLMMVISTIILGLSTVLSAVFLGMGIEIEWLFGIGLFGVLLESSVLLSLAVLFSTFTRPVMVVASCMGIFLIGHWMESLAYFAEKSKSQAFYWFESGLKIIVPSLESFNWRSAVIYGEGVSSDLVVSAVVYSVIWVSLALCTSTLIIWRKDFG